MLLLSMPVVGPKLNSKSSNIALKPIVVEEVTILKIFITTTFHLLIMF